MSAPMSPDGRWYWDGGQWRPVQFAQPPQPPPRRGPLIALVAVLAVLAIAIPVVVYVARSGGSSTSASSGDTTQPTQPTQPTESGVTVTSDPSGSPSPEDGDAKETIKPGEPVTAERLSRVDAAAFYWDLLNRQMTRPVGEIRSAYFSKPPEFQAHRDYHAHSVVLDHRTRRFTNASTSYLGGKVDTMNRCVGGRYYFFSDFSRKWSHFASSDDSCHKLQSPAVTAATDGIVAGGLSPDQAAKVLASLRDEYKGFGNPKQPTLVTAGGRRYVRQVVDYKPVKLADGTYWGTQIFTWAFRASGLDPETWPWYSGLGGGEGLHVVYYLDPASLLPVAAIQRSTPVLDDNGKPKIAYNQTMVFNYAFPNALRPLTLKDTRPVVLALPEGWRLTR